MEQDKTTIMIKVLRIFLLILLFFLAINAVYGGWLLIADPSGEAIQIPKELLEGTPFKDYLIPGIILILANGLLSFVTAFMIIFRYKLYPQFLVLQGVVLIGWLTVELIMNLDFFAAILHFPLYTIAAIFIVSGWIFIRKSIHAI